MKRFIFSLSLCVLAVFTLNAQTVKKYSGGMSKPKWCEELFENYASTERGIEGYYSYYENEDEERIPHGQFCITSLHAVRDFISQEIKGSFKNGVRDGVWTLRAQNMYDKKYIPNYHYEFRYQDGVLNGPFVFKIDNFEPAEIFGTFTNNVMSGHVTIKTYNAAFFGGGCTNILEGEVNEKGNPHGIWKETVGSKVPLEIVRLYYDGCLVYRRVKDISSGEIKYTYQISEAIGKPSDIDKIQLLGDSKCDVGGVICTIGKPGHHVKAELGDQGENQAGDIWEVLVSHSFVRRIFPSIDNWNVAFTPIR